MKQDMDLVRAILLQVEASPTPKVRDVVVEGYDTATVAHHIEILGDAGYLVPRVVYSSGDPILAGVERLTWDGHQFINTVRDDTVWNRTSERIKSTVGTAAVEVWKATAEAVTRAMLGLG